MARKYFPPVRFAMPGRDITVHDLVRGESTFPAADMKDFVIMRSNGVPTYLLAAAVDDVRMTKTTGGARFTLESFDEFCVAHELRRDQFERYVSLGSKMSR